MHVVSNGIHSINVNANKLGSVNFCEAVVFGTQRRRNSNYFRYWLLFCMSGRVIACAWS